MEDGTDSQDLRFLDQLDLDGDGTDEIVVEVRGYESEEFGIYERRNGIWSQVQWAGRVDAERGWPLLDEPVR